jgi:hypothetical protein
MPSPYFLLASAVFLAVWLVQPRRGRPVDFPWRTRLALPVALAFGGVAGSKLPVVLASGDWIADTRTITTALAVGYVMVELTRVALLMPPAARDEVALPLSLALAVLRLGCFANGCCRGVPSSLSWAVDFGDGVRRHPTQLYEACFHLLFGVVILVWLGRREALRGEVLRIYLLAYCAYRFATEWIRPEPPSWWGLTFSQGVVTLVGTGLVALWALEGRGGRAPGKLGNATSENGGNSL